VIAAYTKNILKPKNKINNTHSIYQRAFFFFDSHLVNKAMYLTKIPSTIAQPVENKIAAKKPFSIFIWIAIRCKAPITAEPDALNAKPRNRDCPIPRLD
jgi:hypothetical protein